MIVVCYKIIQVENHLEEQNRRYIFHYQFNK